MDSYADQYFSFVIDLLGQVAKESGAAIQRAAEAVAGAIEQDADVVMFIHREDKGKDESEKTNIAEILIEKHRNGPVGKVELYFDEKTTTFLNLEKSSISEFSQSKISGDLDEF